MRVLIIISLLLLSPHTSTANVITQSVAEVNSQQLTSRQVILTALLSVCMKGPCQKTQSVVTSLKNDNFIGQLSKAIFERLAYFESIGVFDDYEDITKSQLSRTMQASIAKQFQFNQKEVLQAHKIKMLAKKYINFKDKNLSVYITNAEAKKFYTKNKQLYPNGKFADHLAKIKKALQVERKRLRVEDWVGNMQNKYKVKQFIN